MATTEKLLADILAELKKLNDQLDSNQEDTFASEVLEKLVEIREAVQRAK